MPVDDHGAGTARALGSAAVLHRAQAEVVAEQLEQALPFAWLRDDLFPVERELHPLLRDSQHERQQGHSHHDAVERLLPVAGVARRVDVGGKLVHPRQAVQDDRPVRSLLLQ